METTVNFRRNSALFRFAHKNIRKTPSGHAQQKQKSF